MKRYDMHPVWNPGEDMRNELQEDADGEWIRFEEHEQKLHETAGELEKARAELLGWCRDVRDMNARISEATALLERWRNHFPGVKEEWLSSAPAQPAAPTAEPEKAFPVCFACLKPMQCLTDNEDDRHPLWACVDGSYCGEPAAPTPEPTCGSTHAFGHCWKCVDRGDESEEPLEKLFGALPALEPAAPEPLQITDLAQGFTFRVKGQPTAPTPDMPWEDRVLGATPYGQPTNFGGQPAAPGPDVPWDTENPGRCSECDPSFGCFDGSASCSKAPYEQPAAPELSADTPDEGESDLSAAYARIEYETERAESAEAQLAAVRNAVLVSGISEQRADDAGRLAHAICALLTPAPGPGAKEGT